MPLSNAARAAILQNAGLVPGPDGFDLADLERLAEARGWTWIAAPAATHHGRPGRWRATVFVRGRPQTARLPMLMGSRGSGSTEAEALAAALAAPLARERPEPAEDAA